MAKRDAARCRIPLFGLLRCCVAAGRRQSDVVMCSTSQRTPSTSGAQLAFELNQCAQCRAKHDAYGESRITARENVVNMRIHLLKKGVRNFPHTLQRQPASRNCVAAFGWFELRAVSGPRPYDGSAGGPGFSAYGGRRHGSY